MATGDQPDVFGRLRNLLPPWFGRLDESPDLNAQLQGPAAALSFIYDLYTFAKAQTRVATSTGGWLDLTAASFFRSFRRLTNESDASYSRRIRLEPARPRNTREAIRRAVYDLTGDNPKIFEDWRPGDCGGLGVGGLGFGVAGGYGTKAKSYQVLITTPTPKNFGIPNRGGWGSTVSGLGVAANFSLVTDDDLVGSGATASDVLTGLERVRTAGVGYLVRFT